MARVSLTHAVMCLNFIKVFFEHSDSVRYCDFLLCKAQTQMHYICLTENFRKGVVRL